MKLDKHARKYRKNMELRLFSKGLAFEHISDEEKVAELKSNWLTNFAANIKTDDIYIDQFMWHIFSYERLSCIEGDGATTRFLSRHKAQCYIFFQNYNDAYYLENATALTPNDFADGLDFRSSDLYVVGKRFNWTYVVTHERCCGPYYYDKKMLF